MHLTYDPDEKDLQRGTRQEIITNALSAFKVEDREGELIVTVEGDQFGDALYGFVQAFLKITELFMSGSRCRASKATSIGGHRP
jgi:hypothetical protein